MTQPLTFIDKNTGTIKDAVFCFTGKCPDPRNLMTWIAIKAGGRVTKSVTKETTILVIADANSTSAKANKARANGIYLISPSTFSDMCENITLSNGSGQISQIQIEKPAIESQSPAKGCSQRRHSSVRRIQI